MARLNYVKGRWVNLEKPGGQVFFVGGGTVAYQGVGRSDTYNGLTPERPLSTIDGTSGAHSKCVAGRGDTIVLLPGSVTVTAAIALDKDDVTLTGYNEVAVGQEPASWIVNATDDNAIAIDADNVTVEHLYFDDNVATATADSEAIQVVSSGATAKRVGVVIRNCFFDMAGSDTDRDVLRIGFDADAVAPGCVVQGCTLHDADQDGIVVTAGTDQVKLLDNLIYDQVSANTMRYGISCAGDSCTIARNVVQTGGTAGIYVDGTLNMAVDNRVWGNGANTICILAAASATLSTNANYLTAVAAGNLVDYTTDNTSPSANADVAGVFAATPGQAAFDTPTVGGT